MAEPTAMTYYPRRRGRWPIWVLLFGLLATGIYAGMVNMRPDPRCAEMVSIFPTQLEPDEIIQLRANDRDLQMTKALLSQFCKVRISQNTEGIRQLRNWVLELSRPPTQEEAQTVSHRARTLVDLNKKHTEAMEIYSR